MAGYYAKQKWADSWSANARFNSCILTVSMFFFGWVFVQDAWLSLSSGHWQPIKANIVESKINRGNRGGADSPWIEYRYVVDDQTYHSDRIDFGVWSYGDVATYIQRFPVGASVSAYYNPDDPDEAVLVKAGALVANILLCVLMWGIGAVTFYFRFFKLANR